MDPDDLLGLRAEDLDDAERDQLDGLLRDPARQQRRADDLALGEELRRLPGIGGPSLEAVRGRVQARKQRRWLLGGGAAFASASALVAVVVLAPAVLPTERDRGLGGAPDLHLEAAAEGPGGVRALGPDDLVHPDERVVFRVTTGGHGTLSITAGDAAIWPAAGQVWTVDAGTHAPGEAATQSYRPDSAGTTEQTYRATLCPEGEGACTVDELTLRWAP